MAQRRFDIEVQLDLGSTHEAAAPHAQAIRDLMPGADVEPVVDAPGRVTVSFSRRSDSSVAAAHAAASMIHGAFAARGESAARTADALELVVRPADTGGGRESARPAIATG